MISTAGEGEEQSFSPVVCVVFLCGRSGRILLSLASLFPDREADLSDSFFRLTAAWFDAASSNIDTVFDGSNKEGRR